MNTRNKILLGASVLALALGTFVAFSNVSKRILQTKAAYSYTLKMDKENNKVNFTGGTEDVNFTSSSGIKLAFDAELITNSENQNMWAEFASGASLKNGTPIHALTGLTAKFSGAGNLTVTYGFDFETEVLYNYAKKANLSSEVSFNFENKNPSHFILKAEGGAVTVESIIVTYECDTPDKVNLPDITDFKGITFGGEVDAPNHKGEIVYWAGDGGAVSNITFQPNTGLVVDYTAGVWYGVQLFYVLPYAQAGDKLFIDLKVQSTAEGFFKFNGVESYFLTANETMSIRGVYTLGSITGNQAQTAVGIVLGSYANGALASGTFKVTYLAIHIDPTINPYHDVTFYDSDSKNNSVFSDYVRHGQPLMSIPTGPTPPEGKLFYGWKNASDDAPLTAQTQIVADTEFVPDFVDDSVEKYTVSFEYDGNEVYKIEDILAGNLISNPNLGFDVLGFGYSQEGIYDDSLFQTPHDFTTPVNSDLTLYVNRKLAPTQIYNEVAYNTPTITADEFSITGINGTADQAWKMQVNFGPVPNRTLGNNMDVVLSFDYSAEISGTAQVQVYHGADDIYSVVATPLTSQESFAGHVQLAWNTATYNVDAFAKLTFELGLAGANTSIAIRNMSLVATPAA